MVIERVHNGKPGAHWLCRCDCGREDVVHGSKLSHGLADSCKPCGAREATNRFNGWKYRDGKKRCSGCEQYLPIESFSAEVSKGRSKRFQACCKDCARIRWIAGKYGVTAEWFRETLAAQHGKCAICKRSETMKDSRTGKLKNFVIDHEHVTKQPRGILCHGCNSMLGYAHDNPTILKAAIKYLSGDRHGEK